MKRTTISLPNEVAAALEREARRRRVPVSQVAREAIETRLGLDDSGARDLPWIGAGESSDGWAAADSDSYLDGHWGDEIEGDAVSSRR